jgi:hypothetical protein
MRITQTEAATAINAISDQWAFTRHTIAHAIRYDDYIGYLFECFFKGEHDLENGRKVTKEYLSRKLLEFNRMQSFKNAEAQYIAENRLVKQDTQMGQVYYETLVSEPAD